MSQSDKFGFVNTTGSLRQRVQKGGVLVLGGYGAAQFLRLASNLILTRLLAPDAFGLIAAAVAVTTLAIMMTDIGIHNCIVRSPNAHDKTFLRTAWTIKILRNFLIWTIVMLVTGIIALLAARGATPAESTFSDPRLPLVMVLCSLQLIIAGFESVNKSISERNLTIGRNIFHEVSAQFFAACITITCAFNGFGVWSLVAGILGSAIYRLVTSYLIFPGPSMGFEWNRAYVGEILNFGKWLALASFFGFMTNKGDHVIFGWALDGDHFGLYAIAAIWISIAYHLFESITSKLFFPAISEVMRDRPGNTARAYRQSRVFLDAGAVMMAFGIYFLADFGFGVLYPDNFSGVAYYLKLLSPVVLFAPYRMLSFMILSNGDTKRFTMVSFVTGLSTLILTPLGVLAFGAQAGVIIFACITATSLPVLWSIAGKIMPLDWRIEIRMLIAAGILAALLSSLQEPAEMITID
ncbi:MAG: oligosaccharide flippase family protein [Pseudomonadota bacterium]